MELKCLICCLCIGLVRTELTQKQLDRQLKKCIPEAMPSKSDVYTLKSGSVPTTTTGQCLMLCLEKNVGIMEFVVQSAMQPHGSSCLDMLRQITNDKYNELNTYKFLKRVFPESRNRTRSMKITAAICGQETSTLPEFDMGTCFHAFEVARCLKRSMKSGIGDDGSTCFLYDDRIRKGRRETRRISSI